MIDLRKSGRTTSWRFVRVRWVPSDSTTNTPARFEELGEVGGIESCSIDEAKLTSLKVSGSVVYVGNLDLGDDLLRVYADMELDGQRESKCYGTFFCYSSKESIANGVHAGTADLYSTLTVLDKMLLESDVTLTAIDGSVIEEFMWDAARLPFILTPTAKTLSVSCSWDAGTSTLDVMNDVCDALGYGSLDVDVYGNVVAAPYQDPDSKEPADTFSDTEDDVCNEEVEREWDVHDTPNVVVVRCRKQDDTTVSGTARNDDAHNAYSTVSRKREITRVEDVEGLATAEECQAKAEALLIEGMQAIERLTVRHAGKRFEAGDTVAMDYQRSGLDGKFSAYKRSIKATPDIESETTMRRTVRLYGNVSKS